jgi:hypothetical protein
VVEEARGGRPGVAGALAEHPDRIIEAVHSSCPHCAHALELAVTMNIGPLVLTNIGPLSGI